MLLKRVEMTGFKSFATKTTVEFLPGITIIVGPNGCGKSNIFDAVRWVLGEQSAKSLRGTRMGDVIFAGSSSYKALSYAQVTLVIDNRDRKIPMDFTEIAVTRRLFRSGESEYLLNKVPCRLKDIVSLFMDTGIGTDAYSVLEQGRVDQIIRAKPLERRYLFEEAAGISKYKSRKEEALRKLIRTEEDLLRIGDIVEEVRRTAGSLKRQAAKAERFKKLKALQYDIEKSLLVLRYQFLLEHSSTIEKEHEEVSSHHAELSARLATLNSRNEEGKIETDRLSGNLSEAQGRSYNVGSEIERTENQIQIFKERIINADESREKIDGELAEEQTQLAALEKSKLELDDQLEQSGVNLARIEKEYGEFKSRFDKLEEARREKLADLEKQRQLQADCLSDKTRLQNEIRYSEAMKQRLTDRLREEHALLQEEQNRLGKLAAEVKKRNEQLATCESEIRDIEKRFRDESESIRKAEAALEATRLKSETTALQLRQMESRLGVLRELIQNYEGCQQGVKAVMNAAQKGEMKGISGMIAACISLPRKYEKAIEAALGNALQCIVIKGSQEAVNAVLFLKDKKAGQAGFISRDLARFEDTGKQLKALLSEKGVLGLARDFVETDKENRILLNALLGDTLLVDQLDTAMSLFKRGHGVSFVTLEGESLEPSGVIRGGSSGKAGLLSREREARDLEDKIGEVKKECKRLAKKILEEKKHLEERKQAVLSLSGELHERAVRRASLQKDLESADKNLREKQKILQDLETRVAAQRAELDKFQGTISKNTSDIGKIDMKSRKISETIQDLQTAIQTDQEEISRLDENVSGLLLEQTRHRERCHALKERLAILQRNLEDGRASISRKKEEMDSLATKKIELSSAIGEMEEKLQDLIGERESIDQEITFQTQQRETLVLNLKKLGQELTVVQRDFNEVQNNLHEIDLKKTQYAAQEESLSQQAEEKFQKNIGEIVSEIGEVEGEREELLTQLNEIRSKIDRIGIINAAAVEQYEEAIERFEFLSTQQKDLREAKESLKKTIAHIDQTTTKLFTEAFETIREHFIEVFRTLFNGGRADLILIHNEENPDQEPGVEIVAQPPGKKLQNISLLSGGEKSLTAIALLFSIFMFKPSPFCLLDEIDAALDDVNVGRFKELLQRFCEKTQFVIVTHNKQTMNLADSIYGVTMQEPGVTRLVSVRFEDVEEKLLVG